MVFNADKCKVLHFGHNNEQVHCVMDGNILESVEEERDLGVIIQNNLKVEKQCAKTARTSGVFSTGATEAMPPAGCPKNGI